MTKDELEAIIIQQLNQISEIKTYVEIWTNLCQKFQPDEKYRDVYEWSPYFWQVVLENFQDRFLMETAKLFDDDRNCRSIDKLIKTCEQNHQLFPDQHIRKLHNSQSGETITLKVPVNLPETIRIAQEKYNATSETRKKLKMLRDKHLAHSEKKYYVQPRILYKEVSLSHEDFQNLVTVAGEIANSFLCALTDSVVCLKHQDVDDYIRLLDFAHDGIESYHLKWKTNS